MLPVLVVGILDFSVTDDDTVSVKSTEISDISTSLSPELSLVIVSVKRAAEPSS